MKVAVLKGHSQYDLLRFFADELATALTRLKIEVIKVDFVESEATENLKHLVSNKDIDAVFSFNGIVCNLQTDGINIYDLNDIKFVGIFVDHPLHHLLRIRSFPRSGIMTFVDKTHVDWVETYIRPILSPIFLPHGGSASTNGHKERSKNFIFSGTYKNYSLDNIRSKNYHASTMSLIEKIYERMESDTSYIFHDAIDDIFAENGLSITLDKYFDISTLCFHEINNIRTSKNRLELLNFFEERELPVDIVGNDEWKEYCDETNFLTYIGKSKYEDIKDLYKDYKFVLNDNNDFPSGSHERVFNAIRNGALPISPSNPFYCSDPELKDLGVYYSRRSGQEIPSSMKDFDSIFEKFSDARAGSDLDQDQVFGWGARAASLLRHLESRENSGPGL